MSLVGADVGSNHTYTQIFVISFDFAKDLRGLDSSLIHYLNFLTKTIENRQIKNFKQVLVNL